VNAFSAEHNGGYAQYRYDKEHKWCPTHWD